MKYAQDTKLVIVTQAAALVDNAAVNTASIDTRGFSQVDIYVAVGATDIGLTTLKLQQSDVDSAYADVPNTAYGTVPGTALPGANDDNKVYAFHVDMRGKKRFLDVVAIGGDGSTGTYITIFALLSRGQESPDSASARGLAQEIYV